MSHTLPTYSFLPWLRQGIANNIADADLDPDVKLRATIPVRLALTGTGGAGGTLTENVNRDVQLFGPGDIIGIDSRAIVRTAPRPWITNFEANYLPFIEFYDEDFPWRYTPAAANMALKRLRPWIMLVVLKEGEFEEGKNIKGKPLPFIRVSDMSLFPPAEQLWAWAHVHVNRSLAATEDEIVSTDMAAVLPKLQAVLNEDPDLAYSRIMCPRRLEADTGYHAFLVPVFESGRLAGLGLPPETAPHATFSAWSPYPSGTRLDADQYPIYHRWYFRTGTVGDFEYLVRLLQPKPVDSRVGRRDMDVQEPGANVPGITDPDLGGILKLGGALRVPLESMSPDERAEAEKYENWAQPYPHDFQTALAALINLADDYAEQTAEQANRESGLGPEVENNNDPIITAPLYGRWHALMQRLLESRAGAPLSPNDNWVHELNLDPRFRVPAGFGTRVVQERQEELMDAAWEQIGEVLEANRRIRAAQLAKEISFIWYDRHLQPLRAANAEKALVLTAPVQKRVVAQGFTVHHHLARSLVTPAHASTPMRKALRPAGRLMRALTFDGRIQPANLLARVNGAEVSAAPPKKVPPGVLKLEDAVVALQPKGAPGLILRWLRRYPWLKYLPLALAALILLVLLLAQPGSLGWIIGIALIGGAVYLYRLLLRWSKEQQRADDLREENQIPEAVDRLPRSPDFAISEPGAGFEPKPGDRDSAEATRFKAGLRELHTVLAASAEAAVEPPRVRLDVPAMAGVTLQGLDPEVTIPKRTLQAIFLPARLKALLGEVFQEVMAYPQFDMPMYKPLADISSELFLPNIHLIEQNSITLLETNQKFIEAYMVGLNHEFARELLWREYPTDQRGSFFRQFWDVSSFLSSETIGKEALQEKLRDIPPLHRWPRASKLGDHDHREEGGEAEEEVVLVIRGELLKKYPTAVVYAHRADWQRKSDGKIDNTKERLLVPLSDAEEERPPRDKLKTPLYEAKVEPDIYFFGFDLTVTEARGGTGEQETDDPGWYFVIKERPGEPRFGLDISRGEGPLNLWNDLSWDDVLPGPGNGFLQINQTLQLQAPPPGGPDAESQGRAIQHQDDKHVQWNPNTNAADLAYILHQVPVLIAVHAAEMLPKQAG